MATFFDTHSHINMADFDVDRHEVISRAQSNGIMKIVVVGIDLPTSKKAISIAEQYPNVFAVIGCHPNDAVHAPENFKSILLQLAAHPKVVAIGETGLDYYRLPKEASEAAYYQKKQTELFHIHLEVASETGLNCVIHQRDAFDDVLNILKQYKVSGVFHCFSDTLDRLKILIDLGYFVSYTGIVTFKNAINVRNALASTPPDRLMLETDCPFLAPTPWRGKRCEPMHLIKTAETAANVLSCSLYELSHYTCQTASRFFKWKDQ